MNVLGDVDLVYATSPTAPARLVAGQGPLCCMGNNDSVLFSAVSKPLISGPNCPGLEQRSLRSCRNQLQAGALVGAGPSIGGVLTYSPAAAAQKGLSLRQRAWAFCSPALPHYPASS